VPWLADAHQGDAPNTWHMTLYDMACLPAQLDTYDALMAWVIDHLSLPYMGEMLPVYVDSEAWELQPQSVPWSESESWHRHSGLNQHGGSLAYFSDANQMATARGGWMSRSSIGVAPSESAYSAVSSTRSCCGHAV
jgi:hypothetical protein